MPFRAPRPITRNFVCSRQPHAGLSDEWGMTLLEEQTTWEIPRPATTWRTIDVQPPTPPISVYLAATDESIERTILGAIRGSAPDSDQIVLKRCPDLADVIVLGTRSIDDTLLRRVQRLQDDSVTDTNVLVVTETVTHAELESLVMAGVLGVARLASAHGTIAEAVATVAAGGGVLPPDLIGHLLRSIPAVGSSRPGGSSDRCPLDERTLDVLRLLAEGYDTHEIAAELFYSVRTIKGIVHQIVRRFGLRNRSHAVAHAIHEGWI